MKSRERALTAISHTQPDRVPIQYYGTPEVDAALKKHFGGRDILEVLEVDFCFVAPKFTGTLKTPEPGSEADAYDIWGVGFKRFAHGSGGAYNEACDLVLARLETMEDVENYPWPSPDDYDFSALAHEIRQKREFALMLGGAGMPDIINGVGRGRGMERVLMDIALGDEVGLAIIDRRVEFWLEHARRGLEAGGGEIDILFLGEDLATQKGLTVSPEMFDAFFRPRLQKFIDLAHAHGAKCWLHCCGASRPLHPRFIEMGIDVLDSVQPEPAGMVAEELKAESGDRLTFCGLISTQRTLPHGTVEDCRRHARHTIDVMTPGGGYIFAPAHQIQPDTPLENTLAVFEEATGKKLI